MILEQFEFVEHRCVVVGFGGWCGGCVVGAWGVGGGWGAWYHGEGGTGGAT